LVLAEKLGVPHTEQMERGAKIALMSVRTVTAVSAIIRVVRVSKLIMIRTVVRVIGNSIGQ
jgi:hypothetical protein